jgi:hypothetical protein
MASSFRHDDLGKAMLSQTETGVDVLGIFETRGIETEYSELSRLYCAGLSVRQDGNPGIMHHKAIILDDEVVINRIVIDRLLKSGKCGHPFSYWYADCQA